MKKLIDMLNADLDVKRFLLGNRRFALWQKKMTGLNDRRKQLMPIIAGPLIAIADAVLIIVQK